MKCPKCEGEMETGVLLDRGIGNYGKPLLWLDSDHSNGVTKADPKDDAQLQVDAYRCEDCGFVELYAGL